MLCLPALASDPKASLVWCENNATQNNYILLSHLLTKQLDDANNTLTSETWTEPLRIHTSEHTLSTPSYIQNNDQKMLVWSEIVNKKPALMYSYSSDGKNWNQPRLLTKSGENLGSTMLTARDSSIWAFWSSDRNGLDDIFSSRWNGAAWSSPKIIHAKNDVPDVLPTVQLNDDGNIQVSWKQYSTDVNQYIEITSTIKQDLEGSSTEVMTNEQDTLLQDLTQIPFDISQSRAYIHVPRNRYQQSYTSYQQ